MLHIEITKEQQFKATFHSNSEEEDNKTIEMNWKKMNIKFEKNEIMIDNDENEEGVISNIFKEIVDHPGEIKKHHIQYQQHQYEIESDTLISMILHQVKYEIERQKHEIKETIVDVETENH